jgi:uncharacterized membrane protein
MWEFIKGLYYRARNVIAMAYVRVVDYSMELASKGRAVSFTNGGTTFKSFMLHVASFAVFLVAHIGFKIVIGLVLGLLTTVLAVVMGELLATLTAFVLALMFIIDLFQTIEFLQKLNRAVKYGFMRGPAYE